MFHPDLSANIDPMLRFNAITGTNNVSPDLFDRGGGHGTSVAGLIGGVVEQLGRPSLDEDGNPVVDINGNTVFKAAAAGVAPNVTIVPISSIAAGPMSIEASRLRTRFNTCLQNGIDITNNSWGPADDREPQLSLPPDEFCRLLRESVLFGATAWA